ncbi:MAG TPA: hypothetical protein VNF93_02325 [Buchnera sp. (in: enterobacteria)]|nr:hypothetical protein [Buchnera sp. (in: enterobacteria)]
MKGKEATIANKRQKMFQERHNSDNEFVKKQQAMTASMGGKAPNLESRYTTFDACMVNDGEHAQEFARSLTSNLDKKAYPVK